MVTRSPRKGLLIAAALVLGLLAFAPATASAQLIDPSTLQMSGTLSNTIDPVQLGNTGLVNVNQVSGGAPSLTTPFLLIVGVPNQTGTFFSTSSILSVNGNTTNSPAGGNNTWQLGGAYPPYLGAPAGSTWGSNGYAGSMGPGGEAYATAGIDSTLSSQDPNNSNNFPNWSGADKTINGITANGFGLYVFQIYADLADKGTVAIQFDTSVFQAGDFVIAYGQATKGKNQFAYDTPFTEAGLETGQNHPVPEPSTIALALSGLVGVGFAGLRRLRRPQAAAV